MKNSNSKYTFAQRLLALVLAFAMIYGILPTQSVSADTAVQTDKVADPGTVNTYTDMLGDLSTNGNRYAGRIWTDKSVYSDPAVLQAALNGELTEDQLNGLTFSAEEFMVVYSTLGSTTSVSTETMVASNMDVVIVIDISASMGGFLRDDSGNLIKDSDSTNRNRLEAVTDAANVLISGILENSSNRLAIVTYSTNATQILPLDSYAKTDACLTDTIKDYGTEENKDDGYHVKVDSGDATLGASAVSLTSNSSKGSTVNCYQQGTNMQSGINKAGYILNNSTLKDGEKRTPVIIVLTDGVADYATQTGMIGDTTNSSYVMPTSNELDAGVAMSTILNAAYWKYTLSQRYNTNTYVYSVGVDIGTDSDANVVMDPATYFTSSSSNSIAQKAYAWYLNWSTGSSTITGTTTGSGTGGGGGGGGNSSKSYTWTFAQPAAALKEGVEANIGYVDKYYNVTSAKLSEAFDDILTRISEKQDAFHAITDSVEIEGDTPLTYVDFIGDYMEVKDFKGITLYGKWYAVEAGTAATVTDNGTVTVTTPFAIADTTEIIDPLTGKAFTLAETVDIKLIHTYTVDSEGNRTSAGEQELWIHLDKEVMPLIRHKIETLNGVTTYTVYEQYPVRFYYTVGISEYIAPAGNLLLHRVDADYLASNTVDGKVNFYTNQYYEMNPAENNTGYGDAHAAATPSDKNRYYFHQYNFNIYTSVVDANGNNVVTANNNYGVAYDASYVATPLTFDQISSLTDATVVYTKVQFHVPGGTAADAADGGKQYTGAEKVMYVYTTWADLKNDIAFYDSVNGVYINSDGTTSSTGVYEDVADRSYVSNYTGCDEDEVQLYLGIGSWRVPRLHNMVSEKTENPTNTAPLRVAPTLSAQNAADHEGAMVAWLGNNGRISFQSAYPKTVVDTEGKDIDGQKVMLGDILTYNITAVSDKGGTTITITDTIPTGTTYVDNSAVNGGVYDAATKTITWTIENVGAGEEVSVSFRVKVTDPTVDSIDNTATIKIGDHDPYVTNTTKNYPEGKVAAVTVEPVGENGVQVGSHITYTIYYYNTEKSATTFTITDKLPDGTSFVSAEHGGVYDATTDTVTWKITNVPAGTSGSVSFDVHVDADAVTKVVNFASIKVGTNDPYVTNTTENILTYGSLKLSKTVINGHDREFTLVLQSGFASASALNGTFNTAEGGSVKFEDGQAKVTIKGGQTVTILGLPAGITVSVYEEDAAGYTPEYSADAVRIVADSTVSLDVTNRYSTVSAGLTLTANKALTNNRTLPAGLFSFQLLDGETQVAFGSNDASGNVKFSAITYHSAGTYTYTMKEVNNGITGVQYDSSTYEVKVVVEDNEAGALYIASVSVAGTQVYADTNTGTVTVSTGKTFTNTFTDQYSDTAVYIPEFYKTLTGRNMADGEFTFKITDGNVTYYASSNDSTDGVAKLVTSEAIAFTSVGEYTYKISEVKGTLGGVTYDDTVITMVVTVATGSDGKLAATAKYYNADGTELTGQEVGFVNTYKPTPITITPHATKVLDGKNLKDGEFRFELIHNNVLIGVGTNDANGLVTFQMHDANGQVTGNTELTFTKAGTYTYTVREINDGKDGYTYSSTVYTVTVTVTDDGQGNLSAAYRILRDGVEVGAVSFYNSYTPAQIEVDLDVELDISKVIESPTNATVSKKGFTFYVRDWNNNLVATGTSDKNGKVTFDNNLVFTMEGDYRYSITEATGSINSMTYDPTVWIVHVKVTYDADNGILVVNNDDLYAHVYTAARDHSGATDTVVFTNRYEPDPAAVTIQINKVLSVDEAFDRQLQAGEFTFQLIDESGAVVAESANDANGNVSFDLTFDKVGAYYYKVKEVNGGKNGITYDTELRNITVLVWDEDMDGVLNVDVQGNGATFTNIYKAEPVKLQLGAVKILSGKNLHNGEFSFEMMDQNGKIYKATNDASGNILFDEITYDAVGTYVYSIYEVAGDHADVTYAHIVYTATVTVTDDKEGKLIASVVYTYSDSNQVTQTVERPLFYNIYDPVDLVVVLNGVKTIDNKTIFQRPLTAGEFTFVAKDANGEIFAMGTNDANGVITLGNFTYSLEDMVDANGSFVAQKQFTYTVSELIPQDDPDPYMDYSDAAYTLVITVNYDMDTGLWSYSVTVNGEAYTADAMEFVNIQYKDHAHLVPEASKTTENAGQAAQGSTFSFDVFELIGGQWIEVGTGTAPVTGTASAVHFSELTINSAGTHYFLIMEANAGKTIHGITYDAAGYVMKAEVVYKDHQLIVDSITYYTYDSTAANGVGEVITGKPAFSNKYDAKASLTLTAKKELSGRDLRDDEFSFLLIGDDGTRHTGVMKANGEITFGTLYYDLADLAGAAKKTFHYTMSEVQDIRPGVTYDTSTYDVYVTVINDGNGNLNAYLSDQDGNAMTSTTDTGVTFRNTYNIVSPTTITILAEKVLDGRTLRDGEFDFGLYADLDGDGTYTDLVDLADNDADGLIDLVLTYPVTTADGTEFSYILREINEHMAGVTYSGAEYAITVTVGHDNGNAALTVTKVTVGGKVIEGENGIYDATETAVFVNTYKPAYTQITFEAVKNLIGRALNGGEFFFQLKDADGNVIEIAESLVDGTIRFSPVKLDKAGTYTFTISEVQGTLGGVRYDDKVVTVTVTVTDDGDGALKAVASYDTDPVFVNYYHVEATDAQFVVDKVLNGRDLVEGEFSFELYDADGKLVETVKNAANGKVIFTKLSFDKIGTYTYTIREVKGTLGGITYDEKVITATVTVTDDGNGKLIASVAYDAEPVFVNTYKANGVDVTLEAEKQLSGRDLVEGEFSFELYDADGKLVETVKNAANGKVIFTKLSFDKIGTYTYTIREVNDGAENMTYDDSVIKITVIVTDDGKGALVASVSYSEDAVFQNIYTKPEEPTEPEPTDPEPTEPEPTEPEPTEPDKNPDTGDETMMLRAVLMMLCCLAAVTVLMAERKKFRA